MINIYEKYGYYKEETVSVTLEGIDGAEQIKNTMDNLRNNLKEKIGNFKVIEFRDYNQGYILNMQTNEKSETDLPKSNVLYYELENDNWCCIRPSGTEPKIKVYFGIKGISNEDAKAKLESLKTAMLEFIK